MNAKKIIPLDGRKFNCNVLASVESYNDLKRFAKIDEQNRTISDMVIFRADSPSRNRSVYSKESIQTALRSPFVDEKVRAGNLFGELGHPDPNLGIERFQTIDPNNIALSVRSPFNWDDQGQLHADVAILGPKGEYVWEFIQSGCNPAVSIRILTPDIEEKEFKGQNVIYKYGSNMQLISFDWVIIPGFAEAYAANFKDYNASSEEYNRNLNKEVGKIEIDVEKEINPKEFVNLLKTQEGFDRFQNYLGIENFNETIISLENNNLIVKTSKTTSTIIPNIDLNLVHTILSNSK